MSELQARTPAQALAAQPPDEQLQLLQLAAADRRLTTIEHRIERHLAGNRPDDCPCRPRPDPMECAAILPLARESP